MALFKTKFCWWPARLARHRDKDPCNPYQPDMEFIGWVWMQQANLTNNLNHGWIAFLDDKPIEERCKKCGQIITK